MSSQEPGTPGKRRKSTKAPKSIDSEVARFNMHQLTKDSTAEATAKKIDLALTEEERRSSKSNKNSSKPKFELLETKKTTASAVATQVIQIGRESMRHTEEFIPLPPRHEKYVYTTSKDPQLLVDRLKTRKEEEKKRHFDKRPEVADDQPHQPKKQRATFNSFEGSITSYEQLFDNSRRYFVSPAKRNPKISYSRVPRNVSAAHIAKVLWMPYEEELTECCSKRIGICQSMIGKLKHPLNSSQACMSYLSEIQYEAFVKRERISPMESEQEQFYRTSICVLCYRYNVSRIIANDSTMPGSSITKEIPDYYHLTGVEGEYRQDVCFQNQGGLLRGVNGNVVIFQPDTYVPVVGVVSESNPRVIERVLDMVDYKEQKADFEGKKLAYGWSERNVFVKLNNNTVPECTEINPYVSSYTRIENGPISARMILEGYFLSRVGMSSYLVFKDFHRMLQNYEEIWKAPHPMITHTKLQEYEQKNQYLNPAAESNWHKYHTWEHVCLHPVKQLPNEKSCKVYYLFLYIINGLLEIQSVSSNFPENITKKLKRYIRAFTKMQEYYKNCEGDFTDERIQKTRVFDQELGLECSALFSCYPRVAKIGFVVHEYRYLKFERVTLKVPTPDVELSELYTNVVKPHSASKLSKELQITQLLSQLKKLATGAYHNITVFYNNSVVLLREPETLFRWCKKNNLTWPKNLLVQLAHPKKTDGNRRAEMEKIATSMADSMEKILVRIFVRLHKENKEYIRLRKVLSIAIDPFETTLNLIDSKVKQGQSGVKRIFKMIGSDDLSELLPEDYVANVFGINFIPWTENTILLTALVRVFILERLIALESISNSRHRYLLTLLRNSHIPLVNVICELPGSVPFKRTNSWLRYMSILPQGGYVSHTPSNYSPSLSYFDAYMPYPQLVFHEGRLPNLCSATTQTNYFFDGPHETFTSFLNPMFKHKSSQVSPCVSKKVKYIFSNSPVKHCLKTTITKLSRKKNIPVVVDTVNFGSIIPKRFFVLALLKCSFLGLYQHAIVKPSFRISTQLLSLFDNGDTQDVRELFDEFTTKFTTIMEKKPKKFKFEKIMNDVIMEYVNFLQKGTAIQHTVTQHYGVDPSQKSVFMMDFVRLGISKATLSLFVLDELRQRNPIRLSSKVINTACMSTVDRFCKVILASDEPRYDSANKKHAHIPKQYQIQTDETVLVHCFIDKLTPTSTIYAEDLKAIFLTKQTIEALGEINTIVSRQTYDLARAVAIFEELDIRQSSIVAYFFNTLQEYLRYGELISHDRDFVESQEKALKKVAGIPKTVSDYTLPKSIHHTAFCISCNTWNGMSPSSQYFMKEYVSETCTHYLMPHGNHAVSFDMISGGLTCKVKRKPAKKKKGNARDVKQEPFVSEESLFFSVTGKYLEKSRAEGTEPKRLNTIRGMERRKPRCGEIPLLVVNLSGGRIITVKEKVRHPYGKRKTAQYNEKIDSMTNDPVSIYPPLKPRPLLMANPPYTVSPCCGSIRTTGPQCWGVNGYYCGACLPRSNIELAIVGEILCTNCRQVIPNSGGNRCPIKNCPSNVILPPDTNLRKQNISCTHGISPVYVVDDYVGRPVHAYFCDTCYRDFETSESGLVPISAVSHKDSAFVMNIVEGKEFTGYARKKIISE